MAIKPTRMRIKKFFLRNLKFQVFQWDLRHADIPLLNIGTPSYPSAK